MKLNLSISIDDVNPQKGWRILGDQTEKWLRQLNERYGVKFDLFIPSCYHHKFPLSENKSWINELGDVDYFSLNAHGHFHQCKEPDRFGECEFFELQDEEHTFKRVMDMWVEWVKVDIQPSGFRPPGWLCSQTSARILTNYQKLIKVIAEEAYECEVGFEYVAIHYEHNHGMKWNCKTFFGHDGINQTDIGIHNGDMIMFQSHIAGNHNDNVWNQKNFDQLCLSLDHLYENYDITPKTLKECI